MSQISGSPFLPSQGSDASENDDTSPPGALTQAEASTDIYSNHRRAFTPQNNKSLKLPPITPGHRSQSWTQKTRPKLSRRLQKKMLAPEDLKAMREWTPKVEPEGPHGAAAPLLQPANEEPREERRLKRSAPDDADLYSPPKASSNISDSVKSRFREDRKKAWGSPLNKRVRVAPPGKLFKAEKPKGSSSERITSTLSPQVIAHPRGFETTSQGHAATTPWNTETFPHSAEEVTDSSIQNEGPFTALAEKGKESLAPAAATTSATVERNEMQPVHDTIVKLEANTDGPTSNTAENKVVIDLTDALSTESEYSYTSESPARNHDRFENVVPDKPGLNEHGQNTSTSKGEDASQRTHSKDEDGPHETSSCNEAGGTSNKGEADDESSQDKEQLPEVSGTMLFPRFPDLSFSKESLMQVAASGKADWYLANCRIVNWASDNARMPPRIDTEHLARKTPYASDDLHTPGHASYNDLGLFPSKYLWTVGSTNPEQVLEMGIDPRATTDAYVQMDERRADGSFWHDHLDKRRRLQCAEDTEFMASVGVKPSAEFDLVVGFHHRFEEKEPDLFCRSKMMNEFAFELDKLGAEIVVMNRWICSANYALLNRRNRIAEERQNIQLTMASFMEMSPNKDPQGDS